MSRLNFYTIIIGSELLNGRRVDEHFKYANQKIIQSGHIHKASFVISDDEESIKDIFELVKQKQDAIMLCFGGIGATPDDLTRELSAIIFTNKNAKMNEEAKKMIVDRFGDDAYPYRIKMGEIPENSKLLFNPITNVPGFYLEDKYYFMPGFPSMAQPMMDWIFDNKIQPVSKEYACEWCILASENLLIPLMEQIPVGLNLSSLPKIDGEKRSVILRISHLNKTQIDIWCDKIELYLQENKFNYKKGEIC